MKEYYIKVVFFKGTSFFSKLVRFFTRSKFSHAAFQIEDSMLLEAWKNKKDGSVLWTITSYENHTPGTEIEIVYIPVTKKIYFQFLEICKFIDYVKIPYDFLGVIAFVIPFKLKINGRWFCSEGVYEILKYLGILKSDTPGWKINPDDLYTLLTASNEKKEIKIIGENK